MKPTSPFRALAHRNFRLYILGQGVSILGCWMQQVAIAWLVYELTGSPLWLGLVAFAGQIPALFLGPVTGSVIDRSNRHRLVLLTQTVAMLQAFVLAALTLTGTVAVWHLLSLSLVLGVVNAFDIPSRQSFLSEIVPRREDLPNAIALNSSVWNAARLVGPTLAGVLLLITGCGVCFLLNGLSYLAVLAALLAMRVPPQPVAAHRPLLGGIGEGLAYAWRSGPIRSLLLLIGLFQMAGMAQSTLLPVMSSAVLEGDASTLGLLSAAIGLGAFAAAVFLAVRRSVLGLGRWITAATVAFGMGLVAFSFAGTLWAACLLLVVTGFALLLLTAGANTVMQTIVAEDKRGRVLSLYTMAVTGLSPLGGLLAGVLADAVGAPLTLRLAGLTCLALALAFVARSVRWPALARPFAVLADRHTRAALPEVRLAPSARFGREDQLHVRAAGISAVSCAKTRS
jgi:MFS family permease